MASDFLSQEYCERYLSKLEVLSDEECWNWQGTILQSGYGQFWTGGKKERVHRIAYRWHYGEIPEGLMVLHLCIGNRRCCNPLHLYVGTGKDNISQCSREGRKTRGEAHHAAKVTEGQVLEMRRVYAAGGKTLASLALDYGLDDSHVQKIIRRQKWHWLPEEP